MNTEFKDYEEFFTWLLKGKEIKHTINNWIFYLKDGKFVRKIDSCLCDDYIIDKKYFLKVINWYENIPEQGILCKCWNSIEKNYDIQRVLKYFEDHNFPFKSKDNAFMSATPLTKEEVLEFIYSEKQ